MKKISLTQGKFALVDAIDFDYLSQWKWHLCNEYAARSSKKSESSKRHLIYMHRVIFSRISESGSTHIDHKNQNKLDNSRSNLRLCPNRSLQAANMPSRQGSSRFKGVCWHKGASKWRAAIGVNSQTKYLGLFVNELDAAIAYNKAATKYFGHFATLNDVS